jgi:hypothetical protein
MTTRMSGFPRLYAASRHARIRTDSHHDYLARKVPLPWSPRRPLPLSDRYAVKRAIVASIAPKMSSSTTLTMAGRNAAAASCGSTARMRIPTDGCPSAKSKKINSDPSTPTCEHEINFAARYDLSSAPNYFLLIAISSDRLFVATSPRSRVSEGPDSLGSASRGYETRDRILSGLRCVLGQLKKTTGRSEPCLHQPLHTPLGATDEPFLT